jgi:hypothetical protein
VKNPDLSPLPLSPHEKSSFGGKLTKFELECRKHTSATEVLARVVTGSMGTTSVNSLDLTCPDGRLMTALDLMFVPDDLSAPCTANPSTMHLASLIDMARGALLPVEDLYGTAASPLAFVTAGLWGVTYSPSEEVEAMRADLVLSGPAADLGFGSIRGTWLARVRWQALQPISEIDWREALAHMNFTPRRRGVLIQAL